MAKKANPRRYAQAVFEIAQENNELDRWQSDLQKLVLAIDTAPFRDALESPKIPLPQKRGLLVQTLGGINPLALNLALLLIEKSAISNIREIAIQYKKMLDAYRGIETAEVVTAIPLDEPDKERLKARLNALTGSIIELETDVDPHILGGVVVRVGGKLLDGSTRNKLIALKKALEG